MPYYPIFLDLRDKKILVVGGGKVAQRKVETLLKYNCRIYVISPRLTPYLSELADRREISHEELEALEERLKDSFMVIAATDDRRFNGIVAKQAKERGILTNSVDQPENCNFIVPSIVKRGDLQIAISTGGNSPALAKSIRKEIEGIFGSEYGALTRLMGAVRTRVLSRGKPSSENKTVFQRMIRSQLLNQIKAGDTGGIKATLKSLLGKDFPVDDIINHFH